MPLNPLLGRRSPELAGDLALFTGREWVFGAIEEWLGRSDASSFLLCGGPGTGKSAVAARLVQLARGEVDPRDVRFLCPGFLTYAHFCRALDPFSTDPLLFVRALSEQLTCLSPSYARALARLGETKYELTGSATAETAAAGSEVTGLKATLEVGERSAVVEFGRNVPLDALEEDGIEGPLVVLVDALDESLTFAGGRGETMVTLVRAILRTELPVPVRLILTSRDDRRILDELGEADLELERDAPGDADDVVRYASRRLAHVSDERRSTVAAEVARAGRGNFLYARYVLDELAKQPNLDPQALDLPEGLEGHYRRFLERELARSDEEWRRHRPLLGLIAAARGEGLTRRLLRASGLERTDVEDVVRVLRQYLSGNLPDGPFRLYHQSFREFLVEDDVRSVDAANAERTLATFLFDEYGGEWEADRSYERAYALAHLPAHLVAAVASAELRREREELRARLGGLMGDFAFLEAKTAHLSVDALLSDLGEARAALPADDGVRNLKRAVDRKAHVLRGWSRDTRPAFFAQEVLAASLSVNAERVAAAARARLDDLASPYVLAGWRTGQESPEALRKLKGHRDGVLAAALTPDGVTAISGSADGTVRVWDVASGRCVRTLSGHMGRVNAVAVAPDGRVLLSASDDRTLRVWDLATGAHVRTLAGHEHRVNAVWVLVDAKAAVSASDDWTLKVWNLETGEAIHTLAGHEGAVTAVAVTPDGQRAVSASWDRTVRVWDLVGGYEVRTLRGHDDGVLSVCVHADGSHALSGAWDGTVCAWELGGEASSRRLKDHGEAVWALAAGAGRAVAGLDDGTIEMWDLASEARVGILAGHGEPVYGIAMSADGRTAVSASDDETLIVWDVVSDVSQRVRRGHGHEVRHVALSPDGRRAVSSSHSEIVKGWDIATGEELWEREVEKEVTALTIPNGDTVLVVRHGTAADHDVVETWSLDAGNPIGALEWGGGEIQLLEAGCLVAFSRDHVLRVFDVVTTDLVLASPVNTSLGYPAAFCVAPDVRRVVGVFPSGAVRWWDLDGGPVGAAGRRTDWVWSAAVTSDGGRAILASIDGLDVWNLNGADAALEGELEREIENARVMKEAAIEALEIEAAAELRARERTLSQQLLELSAKLMEAYHPRCRVDAADVVDVAALGDDRAVSVSEDGTLSVWKISTCEELATTSVEAGLRCVAAAPEAGTVVAGDRWGNVHTFEFVRPQRRA